MGAIIVHHRHFPEVMRTIDVVLASGIQSTSLVVVDNSDDELVAVQLRQCMPDGVLLKHVPNHGYAAAVNAGRRALSESNPGIIVVATHEVVPETGALGALVETLRSDASIGVAGPTLLIPGDERHDERIWSLGGRLTTMLSWPQHVRSVSTSSSAETRDWLDGSLCAYRGEALAVSMREDFFMYVEELEFHRRLRSLGWRVVWVPLARATQNTEGTPPYLQARNLQLFYMTWGSSSQRWLSVPVLIMRQGLVRLVRRRKPLPATHAALQGWWGAWRYARNHLDSSHGPGRHLKSFERY